MRTGPLTAAALSLALSGIASVRAADDTPAEGADSAAPRTCLAAASARSLRDFEAQRFGMFIHWGPVSLTGYELGWARGSKVPAAEYDRLYRRFNPTGFNADEWVRIAKASGMRYLVLTAKHMDGFCLWDTRQTDYNIMNSPFGRDVVKELSEACRRGGVRFGAYYCIADWYNPWYPLSGPYYGPRDTILKKTADPERYTRYAMKQLVELATGYGPLECLWFDSLIGTTSADQGQRLCSLVRALQPDILINDRSGVPGDYVTPEARVGRYRDERPWESCMTVGTQWAWKPGDEIKSPRKLLHALIGCAGGDGNLLLDVGPTAQGTIEPRVADTLAQVGDWLRLYGESIYATRGGPYKPTSYLASTRRGRFVYLHITHWRDERLVLPPLGLKVVASRLLTGGTVRVGQTRDALTIEVPPADRRAIDTLVRLELDGSALGLPPVALPPEVTVTASATKEPASEYGAAFALDNDTATKWSAPDGQGAATLELTFERPRAIRSLRLEERARPLVIEAYAVSWWDGAHWRHLLTNTHAVTDRLMNFDPLTTRKLRIDILKSRGTAAVSEINIGDVDD
jgi:alpha-L-fucosidase